MAALGLLRACESPGGCVPSSFPPLQGGGQATTLALLLRAAEAAKPHRRKIPMFGDKHKQVRRVPLDGLDIVPVREIVRGHWRHGRGPVGGISHRGLGERT